ncbi:hypothetical protein Ddc_16967 [Ditylenchus destructor]|nr:hypothetical protein Ddc_16967 [Ditylenchus destructor]
MYAQAYSSTAISELESLTHLWRDGKIIIRSNVIMENIDANAFQLILNSPTILQCKHLYFAAQPNFPLRNHTVFYSVDIFQVILGGLPLDNEHWLNFFEGSKADGSKPLIVLACRDDNDQILELIDFIAQAFSRAVSPCAFKVVLNTLKWNGLGRPPLTPFQKENHLTGEILEVRHDYSEEVPIWDPYTLERFSIQKN